MISMNKSQITNRNQKIAMALATCLLLLLSFGPPLVPSQSTPVNQQALIKQQQRNHYNLIPAVESANLIGNPSEYLAMEPSEIKLVQDLLNSYSQDRQSSVELMQKQQQQQQQHGTPGHYEFEVAPKMEPPSAPRPPFKQANQMCPGSDPFGGFSPKDTLCGDLYQGRVPLNPMGQSVNEQAYPFELIKNKTLQFLAKSLPILKTEYETIPKVARYLPAHQLLNPTHAHSPLGHAHFQALNGDNLSRAPLPPPLMNNANKRRRRKRNAGESRQQQQQQAAIVVAEMLPNATLVVSSAHSAGRIASAARDLSHPATFAMITKDGYRPITGSALVTGNQHRPPTSTGELGGSSVRSAALSVSLDGDGDHDNNGDTRPARQQDEQNNGSGAQRSSHGVSGQAAHKANGSANGLMASRQEARVSARSTANSISATNRNHAHDETQAQVANGSGDNAAKVAASRTTTGEQAGSGATIAQRTPAQQQQQQQKSSTASALGSRCANVNGLLLYTVCQAASALIEPPVESQPATPTWLQAAKQIGSLYSAASSTDSYAPGASNPLWTLWSALSASGGAQSGAQELSSSNELSYKSAGGQAKSQLSAGSSVLGMINLLNPLMSFFAPSLQRTASDNSIATTTTSKNDKLANKQQPTSGLASGLKTASNLLLTGLSLVGLYDWLGSSSASPNAFQNPWAGSLLSALAPTTSTSFARRKKPFDPSEQFVDTPASLAALAAGKALTPGATSGQPSAAKQPPTPCPSVEEYISPTFARNYQGAWKYVVQIPHEGYFTQTIQRSSCVRQKCEFTEGVCHEAPRWVSLLVAEIYYPNAIFGSTTSTTSASSQSPPPPQDQLSQRVSNNAHFIDSNQQQQALLNQLMSAAPSTNSIQHQAKSLAPPTSGQDPMQMTDSLNTYNHNLNSAFLSAANELGLDPTNMAHMQQLANAHNYQLMQRQGQLAQAAEAYGQQVQQSQQQPQQQQQQQQFAPKMQQQPQYQMESVQPQQQQQQANNDYIRALAVETIRQNPHLSIDELIKSLQLSQARRKKRDVQQQQPMIRQPMMQTNAMPQQQQQQPHRIQNRASNDNEPIGNHVQHQQLEFPSPSAIMAQHEHSAASQQQQPLMHELAPIAQSANSIPNSPSATSVQPPSGSTTSTTTATTTAAQENQIECDGHDKIGCYVVRVYYDWFLVNGSCKCWKTDLARAASGQVSSSSSSSSGTGSFIRRIFTG